MEENFSAEFRGHDNQFVDFAAIFIRENLENLKTLAIPSNPWHNAIVDLWSYNAIVETTKYWFIFDDNIFTKFTRRMYH
jgi:hypothetical protein